MLNSNTDLNENSNSQNNEQEPTIDKLRLDLDIKNLTYFYPLHLKNEKIEDKKLNFFEQIQKKLIKSEGK